MTARKRPEPLVHLVQLAGGRGLRAGGEQPKQFLMTARGPLFSVSLQTFLAGAKGCGYRIGAVVVTAPAAGRDAVETELVRLRPDGPWRVAEPGPTRTASTWQALTKLAELEPAPEDLVAVHDAARPFASADLLAALVVQAAVSGGAVPGLPVTDTIVRAGDRQVEYLERDALRAVQTPQVFRWDLLHAAHRWAAETGRDFTDDGGLLAVRGHPPVLVSGEPGNWKVTSQQDCLRAADLLAE